MKTLIVEDDFTSRLLLQELLKPYSEIHIAVNGAEAVDAFRVALEDGHPYDLVCLDIMMPEMDGQEALKELRGLEEARGIFSTDGTKIIMTTALNDMTNIMAAFRELCDGYLVKPIDKTSLQNLLKNFGMIR